MYPWIDELVLEILSIEYHETIMAAAGHQAFAQQHPKLASSHYQQALERGGPEGPLTMNLALCELYQGRLAPAREQLERAATLLPDDLDVRQLLVTLGGGSAVESHTP